MTAPLFTVSQNSLTSSTANTQLSVEISYSLSRQLAVTTPQVTLRDIECLVLQGLPPFSFEWSATTFDTPSNSTGPITDYTYTNLSEGPNVRVVTCEVTDSRGQTACASFSIEVLRISEPLDLGGDGTFQGNL